MVAAGVSDEGAFNVEMVYGGACNNEAIVDAYWLMEFNLTWRLLLE